MKKLIPNLITLCNLLCGVMAAYCAIHGSYKIASAAVLICLGIVFDFFDGMTARLLKVSSPLGKELDSLADLVTSGIAPAFILFAILDQMNAVPYLAYSAFLLPLFAGYRLAKFNIDSRQEHGFRGLPAPANAMVWVGLALSMPQNDFFSLTNASNSKVGLYLFESFPTGYAIALACAGLLFGILMVSDIPMFSLKFNFKEMGWKRNAVRYMFLIGCAVIVAVTRQWYAISLIVIWYILFSLITRKQQNAE
ncbi:MAG: CDP-alcohol phosphatidyltransferase family protein [Bacteroidales bacterium]|nr:CDP-alcohol phosphatidyltransferase family protein [Bacteroidales bacterium]